MLIAVPVTQGQVKAFILEHHRHHVPSPGDKFRIGAAHAGSDELVGVAQVGNPVSRNLNDGFTLEVTRLCSNGDRNVCSFLYAKCARIAKEMGYRRIITYILESEDGASLRAAGWRREDGFFGGGCWDSCQRGRERTAFVQGCLFQEKQKYPTERKQRWVKEL